MIVWFEHRCFHFMLFFFSIVCWFFFVYLVLFSFVNLSFLLDELPGDWLYIQFDLHIYLWIICIFRPECCIVEHLIVVGISSELTIRSFRGGFHAMSRFHSIAHVGQIHRIPTRSVLFNWFTATSNHSTTSPFKQRPRNTKKEKTDIELIDCRRMVHSFKFLQLTMFWRVNTLTHSP